MSLDSVASEHEGDVSKPKKRDELFKTKLKKLVVCFKHFSFFCLLQPCLGEVFAI